MKYSFTGFTNYYTKGGFAGLDPVTGFYDTEEVASHYRGHDEVTIPATLTVELDQPPTQKLHLKLESDNADS